MENQNENVRSEAWAIVSLAFAINGALNILSNPASIPQFFAMTDYVSGTIMVFYFLFVPVVFGIIGRKSVAKKIALAGIIIPIISILISVGLFLYAIANGGLGF